MAKQKIKESNPMSVQKGEAVFCYIKHSRKQKGDATVHLLFRCNTHKPQDFLTL